MTYIELESVSEQYGDKAGPGHRIGAGSTSGTLDSTCDARYKAPLAVSERGRG
ncbi:MAG: hypothetical protein LC772_05400 [Chloroflexi bacterium]|nr:hypothetical protein [Chloroflexota bacterium]